MLPLRGRPCVDTKQSAWHSCAHLQRQGTCDLMGSSYHTGNVIPVENAEGRLLFLF